MMRNVPTIFKEVKETSFHKMKLLNTCIIPVLTYGAQSWTLTEELKQKLRTAQNDMERKILNIRRSQRVSIRKIKKLTKSTDIVNQAMNLKWTFAGHVQRYPKERWSKKVENWTPPFTRRRGRPREKWSDMFSETYFVSWRRQANNRERWRKGNPYR